VADQAQLLPGTLDLLILKAVSLGPLHGYGVLLRIGQISGSALLAFGSAAGLLLGAAATRVLSFIVYQATPHDPLVMTGVVLVMLLLGLLAVWIPARRALAADPSMLLREE
jgi:ABC-type antimicrobial peptide transport system permease subunit